MDDYRSNGSTSEDYPVDANALQIRQPALVIQAQEDELARLEERASEVERALRKVDQEILSLEYAASLQSNVGRDMSGSFTGPSVLLPPELLGGQDRLSTAASSQPNRLSTAASGQPNRLSTAASGQPNRFSAADESQLNRFSAVDESQLNRFSDASQANRYSSALAATPPNRLSAAATSQSSGPQQIVINNYHHQVNQMYNTDNRIAHDNRVAHSSFSPKSSRSSRRRRRQRTSARASGTHPAAPQMPPRGTLAIEDRPGSQRMSSRVRSSRARESVRLQLVESPRDSQGFHSGFFEDDAEDDYMSVHTFDENGSFYSRGRGIPPPARSVAGSATGHNVFRDISAIAKEKADDEEKDLMMALKASIGFAAAIIGEALFLRLREWLENTKPGSAKQEAQEQSAPISSEELAKLAADVEAMVAANGDLAKSKSRRDEREQRETPGQSAVERAKSNLKLRALVQELKSQGKFREAELLLRKALAVRRKEFGNDHPAVAHSLNQLGSFLSEQGKLEEAEELFQEALGICKKVFPKNHPKQALLVNNLAVLFLLKASDEEDANREDHERDALALGHRAYEIAKETYGKKHPITLAYKTDWGYPDDDVSSVASSQGEKNGILSKLSSISRRSSRKSKSNVPTTSSSVDSTGNEESVKKKPGKRRSCVVQ